MPRLKTGTPHADATAEVRAASHRLRAQWHADRSARFSAGAYAYTLASDDKRASLHRIASRHDGRSIAHSHAAAMLLGA